MSWAVRYLNEPKWRAVNSGCNIELFCENLLSVMDGNFGKELGKMCLLGKWSRVETIFLLQCSVQGFRRKKAFISAILWGTYSDPNLSHL